MANNSHVAFEQAVDTVDRTGTPIRLRAIRPDDAERLVRFHEGLSPESCYLRYFTSHRHLSPAEVHHLTEVDSVDRVAVVALHGDELVGVGRYDRPPGVEEAEVAFVVADQCQHHGIGGLLLEEIAAAARRNGLRRLTADVLLGNPSMMAVFHESGYPLRATLAAGVVHVEMEIA